MKYFSPKGILLLSVLLVLLGTLFCHFTYSKIRFAPGITQAQQSKVRELFRKNDISFARSEDYIITDYSSTDYNFSIDQSTPLYLQFVVIQKLYRNLPIAGETFELAFNTADDSRDFHVQVSEDVERAFFNVTSEEAIGDIDIEPSFPAVSFEGPSAASVGEAPILSCFPETWYDAGFSTVLYVRSSGLVWRVAPTGIKVGTIPEVWVDAHTGEILSKHLTEMMDPATRPECETS